MKVNTGSQITVLECHPYYMAAAHEGQHWKLNLCTWMPPLLYDRDSWRSTLEVKSLYLNASPTIRQRLMKVNTGSEITVLESLTNYMIVAHGGQHRKLNLCTWITPLLYDRDSWRSKLAVKSLYLNASPTLWQRLMKVNIGSENNVLEFLPYYMILAHEGQHWKWNHCPLMPPLLYGSGSWRSTLEVKSLFLYASPSIWHKLMKVNTGSEITVLECLPYYMIVAHDGQYWNWNHWPWMPPPTIWQRLMNVNIVSKITHLEWLPNYMTVTCEGQH